MTANNLFDVLAEAAAAHGDREFMITGERAEVMSFREFAERADRFGRMLAGLGVSPGDRVAVWMTNRVCWAIAAYGAARCGAVTVAVNTRLSAREVAHMLRLTEPRVWVMEANFLGKIQAADRIAPVLAELERSGTAAPRIVVQGAAIPGTLDWDAALATHGDTILPPAAELIARSGDGAHPELLGVAAIVSTSGTTGSPKGVMLTHAGLIREAMEIGFGMRLAPGERFYSVGPLYHCSGYMHGLLCTLIAGCAYYTTPAYRPEETWRVLRNERITVYHGFSIPLQEVERLPEFDPRALVLDRCWFGGSASELARLERVYDARVCLLFGLTETGGNASLCLPDDPPLDRHQKCGRPLPGVEIRVIDPQSGAAQPAETPGEICVRGYNVMRGYFRDPEATARAIDPEGWLRTGDQGVMLPCGAVKWLSRFKDIIRVGGENLAPLEVEEILTRHPAVEQVAVVAGADPRLGEVPVAFLTVKPGHRTTPEDLEAHCRGLLANFKVPRRFILIDEFPLTAATMRIQKVKLREMLAAEAAS